MPGFVLTNKFTGQDQHMLETKSAISQMYQQLLCLESPQKNKKTKKKHSERVRVVYVLSKGGLGMCEPNGFYLI